MLEYSTDMGDQNNCDIVDEEMDVCSNAVLWSTVLVVLFCGVHFAKLNSLQLKYIVVLIR